MTRRTAIHPDPLPSARVWLERLRAREVSSRELVGHVIERIARVDAEVHAIVLLDDEGALAAADAADAARRRGEDDALLGLPLTVKDSLETAGLRSTGGSLARADHVPDRDATVVARVRAAGGIVLGKTNVPEYSSSYETHNLVHGRTNNPHDLDRTPGGSSGGEAALLAAGASLLGIGADGGGSIRAPSHFCGVVGLRPTVGRVPETGNWPATRDTGMMDLVCVGPMARSVEDLALLLPVLAGPDWVDPYAVPVPLLDPARVEVTNLRVGFMRDDGWVSVTPGTAAAVEVAARSLAAAGAAVDEVVPPGAEHATELFLTAVGGDGGGRMREDVAAAGGRHQEQFAALLAGLPSEPRPATEWFAAQGAVFDLRRRYRALFQRFDVLLAPVVAGPAPRHDEPPAGPAPGPYLAYRAFNYTHLPALAGVPAGSVPVGSEDGLPIGVQVVAAPFREDVALAVMAHLEPKPH
jgi:Asp-tRNA(Asn)/Glu-tRNA(Gln) amidotransferase A subunit family amidase